MSVYPILFEDHTLGQFRPLAWSTPVYEIRCGLLNTRERTGLAGPPATAEEGRSLGGLLCRPVLAPLHGARGWTVGGTAVARELVGLTGNVLWLNGRLAPSVQGIRALLTAAGDPAARFTVADTQGLLAVCLPADESRTLLEAWNDWQAEAEAGGCWSRAADAIPAWSPVGLPDDAPPGGDPAGLGFVWDLVPATAGAIRSDLDGLRAAPGWRREPFGLTPAAGTEHPVWSRGLHLRPAADLVAEGVWPGVHLTGEADIWVTGEVRLAPGTAIDATAGPVVLDHGVTVMPHAFLEGPLYLGPGCRVKSGACLYGDSSFGIGNRLAGEIGESTFGDFTNKQHEGFIGHAVLGAWVNLGALTTCSDLKNNYGPVRVDLGRGQVDSGLRFVGLMMGDHVKTAIGSLFNTGTSVGFATNVFGNGMPPKFVDNFRWGGGAGCSAYAVDKAMETAEVVMSRRDCQLTSAHRDLFQSLFGA